ncbi:Monoacylglycerol lipase [Austwickia sp. TVS 96-490-7B]|uniref:alpha/beta hydrolase n=1 Tax=Austwickia sp. TVS 96-490-7B TaxID=2830843 RepID=UPI001C579A1C|nr:alpha/beta hydrolase [Austwickia sp. TVS 96-490-7B]MBW3084080.1 Monoacylglycerol lipase [Austwickia sp. TVS 96-490-7B]
MRSTEIAVAASDGVTVRGRRWLPDEDGAVRAVLILAHGMAEHGARYAPLAEVATASGWAVWAHDHRGHGLTATDNGQPFGHLGDRDGWRLLSDDLDVVRRAAEQEHPGVPVFLLGHSMGSLVVRTYVLDHAAGLAGVVLSGTAGDPGVMRQLGLAVASAQVRVRGVRRPSPLMNALTFGSFNRPFRPAGGAETGFEWLSRDAEQVQAYLDDPWCGFVCSAGFFRDLLAGVAQIHDPGRLAGLPVGLPVLLISGEDDPVGGRGVGVRQSAAALRVAGLRDVTVRLYPSARHEILNETCRDRVTSELMSWLEEHLAPAGTQAS